MPCLAYKYYIVLPLWITIVYINLEGVTLSEINQGKTTGIWFHLYVEFKAKQNNTKQNSYIQRAYWWLPERKGVGDGQNGWRGSIVW